MKRNKINQIVGNFRSGKISVKKMKNLFKNGPEFIVHYLLCEKYFEEKNFEKLGEEAGSGLKNCEYTFNVMLLYYRVYSNYKISGKINEEEKNSLLHKIETIEKKFFDKDGEYNISFIYVYYRILNINGRFFEQENECLKSVSLFERTCSKILKFTEKHTNLSESILFRVQKVLFDYPNLLIKMKEYEKCLKFYKKLLSNKLVLLKIKIIIYRKISFILSCFKNYLSDDYKTLTPPHVFCTRNRVEESYFTLLLSEILLIDHNFCGDKIFLPVYNNMCIILAENYRLDPLKRILPRYLGRNSNSLYVWRKLLLSLMSLEKYDIALRVVKQCLILDDSNVQFLLIITKIYLKKRKYEKALKQCNKILKLKGNFLKVRCYHLLGIIYSKMALSINQLKEKQQVQKISIENLLKAFKYDKRDYKICFHLALQYAFVRDIPTSFKFAKRSLKLNQNFLDIWILIYLLFSSSDKQSEAIETLEQASKIFLGDLKIKILMVKFLKEGNEVKKFISEISEKLFAIVKAGGRKEDYSLLFLLTEICIDKKAFSEAEKILGELSKDKSMENNSNYHYYLGLLAVSKESEEEENLDEGLKEFEKSLIINPNHKYSLVQLGIFYFKKNHITLSTSYLQSAIRIDPTIHMSWYYLGKVFKATKDFKKSTDCFFTAIKLEKTNPSIPFDWFLEV